ncbi:MAG: glycosyltransferase family 39 protein [Planctomycetota bacterium]
MKKRLLVVSLALGAGALLTPQLSGPFNDSLRGSCGAFFSLMARRHLELGLDRTGGIPVMNLAQASPDQLVYYRHHPPGAILLVTLSFAIFGESEPAARLVPLLAFVSGLVALGWLASRQCGFAPGLLAVATATAVPMGAYYGVFVNFEIPTIAAWLVTLVTLARWREGGSSRALSISLGAWALGGFLDWPLYLGTPALVLIAWRTQARNRRTAALLFALLPILVYSSVAVWHYLQQSRWGRFPESYGLASYLAEISPLAKGIHLGSWFTAELATLWRLGGIAVPVALLGTVVAWTRRRPAAPWLLVLLLVGSLTVFLGAGRSLDHDYWSLYFLPWLGLGCADGVAWLDGWRGRWSRAAAVSVALLVLGSGLLHSTRIHRVRSHTTLAQRGRAIEGVLQPHEIGVTTPWDFQVPYYARAPVLASPVPPRTLEQLSGQLRILGLHEAQIVLCALPGEDPRRVAGALAARIDPTLPERRGAILAFPLAP